MGMQGVNLQQIAAKLFGQQPQNPLYPPPDPSQGAPSPQSQAAAAPSSPAPTPTPAAPSPAPDGASLLYGSSAPKPPMSQQDYASANPDASKPFMPARPVGDFDTGKHATLRRILASLFAGTAEFGGELNHHPGMGGQLFDRWHDQDVAQRQYDANQPRMQAGALNQAYQNYLQQGKEQAEIPHTQAETGLLGAQTGNLALNPPGKQDFLKELQQRRSTGKDDPQQLFNEYAVRAPYAHTTRQEVLDVIKNTPVQPFNFDVKDGAIQPGGHLGHTYGPDASPDEPPEIGEARKNALATISQGQKGKIAVATAEAKAKNAINLGNFGQPGDPMIDMVGQGRVDLQSVLQRIPPQGKEAFMASLNAKYPGFNQSTYGISKNVGEAFTAGSQGQQLTAINTAREHMKVFSQLAGALDNGNVQVLNQLGNVLGVQFGNDKATNFKIAAQAFGGEVGKAFDGAGVTEGERKSAQGAFNPNMSPEQFRGAIKTVDALLAGKQKSLQSSYEQGRQGQPNFGSQSQASGGEGPTATGPNGHKIKVVNGKWVDAATGQPIQ